MFFCHPKTEQIKVEFLEYLYVQSGRTSGLYTGLWQEHCARSGVEARDAWFAMKTIYTTDF